MFVLTKSAENIVISIVAGVTAGCVYYYYHHSNKLFTKPFQFEHESLQDFLVSKTIPGIQGLENSYNYCFMNVVLQCHASSPLFIEWLEDVYQNVGQKSSMICELLYIIKKINTKKERNGSLSAINILSQISSENVNFCDMSQHDALEFYEELHNRFERIRKYYAFKMFIENCFKSLSRDKHNNAESEEHEQRSSLRIVTPLGPIYEDKNILQVSPNYGISLTKILCSSCKHYEIKSDPFTYLSLPINGTNLFTCMKSYFKMEHLEGYKCDHCSVVNQCHKQMQIMKLPKLLMIHFQRLTWTMNGSLKLTQKVNFPFVLFMDKFLSNSSNDTQLRKSYRLIGVIVHVGNEIGGHYINYRLDGAQQKWFRVSDQHCQTVSVNTIMNENVYILFYERFPSQS